MINMMANLPFSTWCLASSRRHTLWCVRLLPLRVFLETFKGGGRANPEWWYQPIVWGRGSSGWMKRRKNQSGWASVFLTVDTMWLACLSASVFCCDDDFYTTLDLLSSDHGPEETNISLTCFCHSNKKSNSDHLCAPFSPWLPVPSLHHTLICIKSAIYLPYLGDRCQLIFLFTKRHYFRAPMRA